MFKKLLFLLALLTMQSCEKKLGTEPEEPQWELLGQDGLIINQLLLAGDYLYSCAGRDGLFRLDVTKEKINWEYLGFADSTLSDKYNVGATSIIVDQNNDNLLVGLNSTNSSIGIYRSNDMGLSWTPSDSGIRDNQLLQSDKTSLIAGNSSVVLAAIDDRLYQSYNNGKFWKKVYNSPANASIGTIKVSSTKENTLWARLDYSMRSIGLLLKSDDFGNSWEAINAKIDSNDTILDINTFKSDIVIDPEQDNTIYIISYNLLKTEDNGVSWKTIQYKDNCKCNINCSFSLFEVNPQNSNEFYMFGNQLYHTTNSFKTIECFSLPQNINFIDAHAIDWDQKTVYISTVRDFRSVFKIKF